MTQVMSGIRILEVAEHTFVPLASAILADWGAEVIKVEHIGRGDATRSLGATAGVETGGGDINVLLEHANRGKRSIGLDLTSADGRELLYRLAATCDVFLTNKLPAVRAKLEIDVEHIRAHQPTIIYAQGTGYGSKGVDVDLGGYDALAYWSRAGVAASVKAPEIDYLPRQSAPAFGDSVGAMYIAGGISAALLHRERTGEAPLVDVSLLAAGMWMMSAGIATAQRTGIPHVPRPDDRDAPRNPLIGNHRTADGRFISFCMLQAFEYWPAFCAAIDRPAWVDDPRFATRELLFSNGWVAADLIDDVVASETLETWTKRLQGLKGQWSPVQDTVTIADDPMVIANDYLMETISANGESFRLVTAPVQFDGRANQPGRAPGLGEHGTSILAGDLGLDDQSIADLRVRGVVG
ncbi:CoA transferase [Aeromicrobium sp. SMF47]|nr:CoA transferase [Aeromicrobium yanjiei]MRK01665.1 CoA transferase [Aeromicrobium sp. S22]